jgi:hypothetical protein
MDQMEVREIKDVSRLIIKAKRLYEPNKEKLEYVIMGAESKNNVSCMVWNGKPGQARYIEFECETPEEALTRIAEVAKEYPNSRNVSGINLRDDITPALLENWDGLFIKVDYGDE